MSNKLDQPMVYQIRVKGHLGGQWTDWFGGLSITLEDNGDTLLTGPVVDQAALHGLLRKARDLEMPLLSVIQSEEGEQVYREARGAAPNQTWRNLMKAIVCTKYGSPDVLQLEELERPTPKDNEVLIRVYAASVTAAHGMMRKGRPFIGRLFTGLTRPKNPIPGTELAGEIEAVGKDVKLFKEGDQVFGETGVGGGCYAEYICLPEGEPLATKPANLNYGEAASVLDGASTALHFLRDKGGIQSGQNVLINGASGSVGTSAVQLARYFGAEVTGVCSTTNVELVESLGADTVIDYTQEDFTQTGQTYDIIFDAVGKSSFSRCKGSLKQGGVYLTTVPTLAIYPRMLWTSKIGSKRAIIAAAGLRPASEKTKGLVFVKELLEAGEIKPVIDRRYPLEQTAEAHRYVDKGHKKGNVVIAVEHNN